MAASNSVGWVPDYGEPECDHEFGIVAELDPGLTLIERCRYCGEVNDRE